MATIECQIDSVREAMNLGLEAEAKAIIQRAWDFLAPEYRNNHGAGEQYLPSSVEQAALSHFANNRSSGDTIYRLSIENFRYCLATDLRIAYRGTRVFGVWGLINQADGYRLVCRGAAFDPNTGQLVEPYHSTKPLDIPRPTLRDTT